MAGRALLAVVLFVGFYVLALVIAAVLLYIPYAEMTYLERLDARIALACVISAGAIVWSILPRRDRFTAPGPLLTPQEQPALFAALSEIADSTGQAMPAEVYLTPEVNAWVTQRGGVLGLRSRRLMGLGLPLLQLLSVAQLRAVLAHEFGHYHGGDTQLGPWIYKTYGAIERTLRALGDSLINLPFQWYGKLFLRLTHGISRQQEFTADALAAQTVGAQPLIEGLHIIHGGAAAFGPYWDNEVVPVLRAGYRPPLADGFARFVAEPAIARSLIAALNAELRSNAADPYDTHPPLAQRIAALEQLPSNATNSYDPPATTLLSDLAELENRLLTHLSDQAAALQALHWNDVGMRVYLPLWTAAIQPYMPLLRELTAADLAYAARDLRTYGHRMNALAATFIPLDQQARHAAMILGAALAVGLAQCGFQIEAEPGAPVACSRAAVRIEPFLAIERLASDELTAHEWQQLCASAGIAQLGLGTPAARTASIT